ncbi:MAG: DUF1365 domain-containing protein [Porticoccaceae bacterium]|nr:DUF1365 domain-containing protein [Porticoccaceae bacterium]
MKSGIHSRLYAGTIGHCRHMPAVNRFRYQLFMLYLDLDEVDSLFDKYWLWSSKRLNFAWFNRADHSGDSEQPLADSIRELVSEKTGSRPSGPIRLLTNLRYLFYKSNPVSFYYCFNADDETIHSIVAEVTNTPWGERYCYVLGENEKDTPEIEGANLYYRTDKRFTVSPFMPMDMYYKFEFSLPTEQLKVRMQNHRQGQRVFDVELDMLAQPITSATLAKQLFKLPLMTAKVTAAIYWQALKIWLKRVPFLGHGGDYQQK